MHKLLLVCLLLPIHAYAENFDRPDREPHPPLCDQGAVQRCVQENRAAADQDGATAAALEQPIGVLSVDIGKVGAERDAEAARLRAHDSDIAALSSEVIFLNTTSPESVTEILPGFPSEEEFFRLHPLQRQWLERYPSERSQKLQARLDAEKSEEKAITDHLAVISSNFTSLNDQYTSLTHQRSELLLRVSQHGNMCAGGCRDQVCGGREP